MSAFGFRLWLATLLLLPVAPFAAAQQAPRGSVPLPGGSAPDPEVLKRLAAQLGGASPNIPDLAKLVEQFGKGGKVDQAGLEEQLKKLTQGDQQKLFDKLMKDFGGQLPPGFKLPEGLKQPPGVQPPDQPAPPVDTNPRPQPRPFDPPPGFPPGNPFNPPPIPLPPPGMQPPGLGGLPNSGSAKEAIEFWEKNVGSLNEMPAVRDALIALATSGIDSAGNGKPFWEDMLKDLSADDGGSSGGFFKWLDSNTSGWSLPSGGGGGSGWSPPGSGWSGPTGGGGGFGPPSAEGLGAVGIVMLAVVGAALVGLFFWKVLPVIREGRSPRPLPGQGPWPVDPRAIRSREQLVQAFEYLSVLECGDRAKTWNHVTIADGLRAAVPASATYADALATLYAVARYTPEAEPLSDATVAQARAYLCQLAGVSPA